MVSGNRISEDSIPWDEWGCHGVDDRNLTFPLSYSTLVVHCPVGYVVGAGAAEAVDEDTGGG
jgi:hypothetical protein